MLLSKALSFLFQTVRFLILLTVFYSTQSNSDGLPDVKSWPVDVILNSVCPVMPEASESFLKEAVFNPCYLDEFPSCNDPDETADSKGLLKLYADIKSFFPNTFLNKLAVSKSKGLLSTPYELCARKKLCENIHIIQNCTLTRIQLDQGVSLKRIHGDQVFYMPIMPIIQGGIQSFKQFKVSLHKQINSRKISKKEHSELEKEYIEDTLEYLISELDKLKEEIRGINKSKSPR